MKSKSDRKLVTNMASKIYSLTHDRYLTSLTYLEDDDKIESGYFDSRFIDILNNYYTGDYQNVLIKCRAYVQDNPSNFDIVKLYVRALIFRNVEFIPISRGENVLVNDIAMSVYRVLIEKENSDSLSQYYQLHKSIYGLSIVILI